MKQILNPQSLLWIIGVLQPVSAEEIREYFKISFKNGEASPDIGVLFKFCARQEKLKRIIRVGRNPDLFSLTSKGNDFLTKRHRHSRDRERIYLLKEARKARVQVSHEALAKGLDGAAPSVDKRLTEKGRAANKPARVVPSGHAYWPRPSMKLINQTCQSLASCDTSSSLSFLSFESEKQLIVAMGEETDQADFYFNSLGLMLGISPRLIVQIHKNTKRHYRTFPLKKRGGGERLIDSPRTFLKVIQQFLNDYYLCSLPVHDNVEAFRLGRSIITNASHHTGHEYVANIDIENFFGSISRQSVFKLLMKAGFADFTADMIAGLCTKENVLPQGASTSPVLSNAYLLDFDMAIFEHCKSHELAYSRYADDITISGSDRKEIVGAIGLAQDLLLNKFGLRLNKDKTRIASKHAQQRVTGLVVNNAVRPPRKFRRQVRAAFHNIRKSKVVDVDAFEVLAGYVSYLRGFDAIQSTGEIDKYQATLAHLKKRAAIAKDSAKPDENFEKKT